MLRGRSGKPRASDIRERVRLRQPSSHQRHPARRRHVGSDVRRVTDREADREPEQRVNRELAEGQA